MNTAADYKLIHTPGKRYKTTALFYENRHLNGNARVQAPYNLSIEDHHDTLSMYNIYMEEDTEYDAAQVLLGRWDHWLHLCGTTFFKPVVDKWRAEKVAKDASIAHKALIEGARSGNLTAARTILLDSRKVQGAGRPSNKQINEAAAKAAELDDFLLSSIGKLK
jgi:hypothetical protein